MERCQFIDQCGFYQRFATKNSAAWRGLFDSYCCGGLVEYCERYRLYSAESIRFSDDMMPNGKNVPSAFKMLL
ncbi:MAG: hypothetical protein D6751_11090 [Deltaproteobacteria bacterium]|nr:MAG: hypothetical protein D6751_11090 [Deltaproteobacteria bacterium]